MNFSEMFSNIVNKLNRGLKSFAKNIKNSENPLENIIGIFILIFAAFFMYWSISVSSIKSIRGYTLYSVFTNTSGLASGSDVRLKGVKIGSIKDAKLNPKTYMVEIQMEIDGDYKLPIDTSAKIVSDGFMGDKYISLNLGVADDNLKHRDSIKGTSAKSIEEIISSVLFTSDN
jgi:phospholipid/cholesterol/gamma-HCH transport system substrate-binding protein